MIFLTVFPYNKRMYVISTYMSVLELQNFPSQCSSYALFIEIEKQWWNKKLLGSSAKPPPLYSVMILAIPTATKQIKKLKHKK